MACIFNHGMASRRLLSLLSRTSRTDSATCSQSCLRRPRSHPPFLKAIATRHLSSHRPTEAPSLASSTTPPATSPLSVLSRTIAPKARKESFFPETSHRVVAYWLLGSAASVFGLVVFGGLTRLTESGLSITEWRPVTGSLPPLSAGDWSSEFQKYQSSPEFKMLNPNMDLAEFKKIYYMEWTHRQWGRLVGLTFLLPTIYFIARRKVSAPMAAKLVGISGLIGFQGVLGWWMVKSGLKDDLFAPGSHPRVSQYRLVAHLGTAFACYTAMLWNGLSILREDGLVRDPAAARSHLKSLRRSPLKLLRRFVGATGGLVFITAMYGGLVAGLDAGLIYNEFPYMGEGLTPPVSELFSEFYSRHPDRTDFWWRNMFENPSTVQLGHRILATTTFTAVVALWAYTRFSRRRRRFPSIVRAAVHGLVGLVSMQVLLGISTLIYLVPMPLAAAHQAGSLALLSGVILLGSRLSMPRQARLVAQNFDKIVRKTPPPVVLHDLHKSRLSKPSQPSEPNRQPSKLRWLWPTSISPSKLSRSQTGA